jgi:hypothetical protein
MVVALVTNNNMSDFTLFGHTVSISSLKTSATIVLFTADIPRHDRRSYFSNNI